MERGKGKERNGREWREDGGKEGTGMGQDIESPSLT